MTFLWIPLPASWALQDVQAGLNIVVTVLSAFTIFVFARVCWQSATAQVAKNRNVPLAALLSVNTIGEVIDVVWLLGFGILSSYYVKIFLQCLVVTLLTVTAFLSGPICRYSTRWGDRTSFRDVSGFMANRLESGISHEQVLWNETMANLADAKFPLTQLLDFLPESSSKWIFLREQWNSSWTMSCKMTQVKPIELYVFNDNCTSMGMAIPALQSIFNESDFYTYQDNWEGISNSTDTMLEALVFRIGWNFGDYDKTIDTLRSTNVTILSLRLQNLAASTNSSSWCDFDEGPVERATYTKAECVLQKTRLSGDDAVEGAHPDNGSLDFMVKAYTSYFQGRFKREVIRKEPVTVITPQELVRFFQVYQITQDTQDKHKVTRKLDVKIEICRLSTIFLIVCLFFASLCMVGVAKYGIFSYRHFKTFDGTPQSKLDWMLQSVINQEGSPTADRISARHSVTSMRSPDHQSPTESRRKSDFETATYGLGLHETQSMPYHSDWLSRKSPGNRKSDGYFPLQDYSQTAEASESSLLSKWPTVPASSPFGDYGIRR